jgi:hypothetical protein
MSAKHHLHTAAHIPPHIPPSTVIAALHDHNTALSLQALTQGHSKLPSTDPDILKDTYWYPPDLNPVSTYHVKEVIQFLPYVSWGKKYITFPSCFQDTPQGIRTRADAPGPVVVRAEFRVVRGGAGAEVEGEGGGIGDAEWVLVEDVEVSCAWWMMPFVKGKMEEAHRGICAKVMEKVEMEMRQREIASTSPKSKTRLDEGIGSPVGNGQIQQQQQLQNVAGVDAQDSQRIEMPARSVPEKITYG